MKTVLGILGLIKTLVIEVTIAVGASLIGVAVLAVIMLLIHWFVSMV
jgi:hypothetical protein